MYFMGSSWCGFRLRPQDERAAGKSTLGDLTRFRGVLYLQDRPDAGRGHARGLHVAAGREARRAARRHICRAAAEYDVAPLWVHDLALMDAQQPRELVRVGRVHARPTEREHALAPTGLCDGVVELAL